MSKELEQAKADAETKVKELKSVKTGLKVKVLKKVTRELLKLKDNMPVYIKVLCATYQAEPTEAKQGAVQMDPPILANVVDLETGEEMQMIFPKVLEEEIHKNYPDNSYVDHCFSVEKFKIDGKKYSGFKISEIEVE